MNKKELITTLFFIACIQYNSEEKEESEFSLSVALNMLQDVSNVVYLPMYN